MMLGRNIVRGIWLSIPPFYKSFAQVFSHVLPDENLDIIETMKCLDISYEEDDPTGRLSEYTDPWWETGGVSTQSLVEGVESFFAQVGDKYIGLVMQLSEVQISFQSPGVENSITRRLLADLKIAKDNSLNALLDVGQLSLKMVLEVQELVATKRDMEAGRVPRDLFLY